MERALVIAVFLLLLTSVCVPAENPQTNAPAGAPTVLDKLDEKIVQLSQPGTTVEKAIQLLGQPERYSWERRTLAATNLPPVYLLNYSTGVSVLVNGGRIVRLECNRPGPGFTWQGRLTLGSSLEEVEQVLGAPSNTVMGQRGLTPGILFQDFDGNKGYSVYCPAAARQVQFSFQENKVIGISVNVDSSKTLLSPTGSLAIVREPPPANFARGQLLALPSYNPKLRTVGDQVDLRSYDLSRLDLGNRLSDLQHADFDNRTRWPEKLPEGFTPSKLMSLGKDPGVGLRQLHLKGITGKGVGVGIIDQSLLTGHIEYRDRLRVYEEIHNAPGPAQMHGPAVASAAVGRMAGVAPEADLYYIAANTEQAPWDFAWDAKAIDRLLEISATLPGENRIRVISISHGWGPQDPGYEQMNAAVERARKANVFVISSVVEVTHKLAFHGLGRDPLADPNIIASYRPGSWWSEEFLNALRRIGPRRVLLVPMDARCLASPTGEDEYVFYAQGAFSWCVPWLAGFYALACQVDPAITPERFWALALKTGATIPLRQGDTTISIGSIAQPAALIANLASKDVQ